MSAVKFAGWRRHTAALELVVWLAVMYRGHLESEVNQTEDRELQRLEAGSMCSPSIGDEAATNGGEAVNAAAGHAALQGAQPLPLVMPDARLAERSATLPEATLLGSYVGALQPVLGCASALVAAPADVTAVVRTAAKRRRKEVLATKWYCQYCKHYTERGAEVCGSCAVPMRTGAAVSEAEQLRLQARQTRLKGRELNSAGAGAAADVDREAAGVFDDEERRVLVARETARLKAAIGNPRTIAADESKCAIIDAFLLVHYQGKHSVHPSAGAAGEIDGSVVADFFNTIGRRANNGEAVHPMGGYYNMFLASAVTADLLRQLQHVAETQIGGGRRSGRSGADGVMKNANTFKAWYTSEEGQQSDCYATMRGVVVQQVQRWCASLYAPGGRLHQSWQRNAERSGATAPRPQDFMVRWLPPQVLHAVLYRLCSKPTRQWLRNLLLLPKTLRLFRRVSHAQLSWASSAVIVPLVARASGRSSCCARARGLLPRGWAPGEAACRALARDAMV